MKELFKEVCNEKTIYMENIERKRIKKELIKYYIEEGKNEFVLRLRGAEDDPQIICYYKGIKMFEFKEKFELNKSVFLPNDKNDKENKERAKNDINSIVIPENPINRINKIEELGFKLKLKKDISVYFSDSIDYEKESNEIINILEKNRDTIKKLLNEIGITTRSWEDLYNRKRTKKVGYKTEIKNADDIDYTKIYKMILYKYSLNNKLKLINSKSTGLKSIELDIQCELINFNKMMKNINEFNNVMKEAIEIYALKPVKSSSLDFSNTRLDSEKAYQQKLMLLLNKESSRKKISEEKYSPFEETDIPFEMEYCIYPSISEEKQTDSKREQMNKKGRLDNIVINARKEKLKLIEVKIDEDVIGGTNGIHKHLLDLSNCIQKNPNLVNEILEHVKIRKAILSEVGIENSNFEVPDSFKKIEYYIICGYTNKESKARVEKRYNLIKDRTILDEEVYFSTANYQKKSKKEYKEFKEKLMKRDKNTANEYILDLLNKGISDYCQILNDEKNVEKGIPQIEVKIFITDENFENFEKIN